MSRTRKSKPPNPLRKEATPIRRAINKANRAAVRAAIAKGAEALPPPPRTEGWETW